LKKLIPALTIAIVAAANSAASAAALAPLDTFKTQVVTWAGDIGLIGFIAVVAAMVFAHDHLTTMFGSLTRIIIAVALIVTAGAWLGALGIQTAAGAWLR
jgi:hypothetical protein